MKMSVDRKIFCGLLLWSVAVLMLMSPDSPIHGDWHRSDSACFYMSGRAMMNGLQPYVDFADSKGPLLWLIYGIGYLLSPRSYSGIYLLSCLLYAGIFYYNFKTARIFLKDNNRSLLVTLLMAFPYFLYWFHYEVRAEDFCTLPVAVSMYYLFHLLYNKEEPPYSVQRIGLVLGGCFMALVLIKFSIAAMQGIMILTALWYYVRKQRKFREPVVWLLAGAMIIALPFAIYLVSMGSFSSFVQEYFINTVGTLDYSGGHTATYLEELMSGLGDPARLTLLAVIVFGWWLLSRHLERYTYVPLLTGVFFYCVASKHNMDYYNSICNIFVIYLIIGTLKILEHPLRLVHLTFAAAAIITWGVMENTRKDSDLHNVLRWSENEEKNAYHEISDLICTVPHPKIMYLLGPEWGYGLRAGAFPAGKYWVYQYGSTPMMDEGHIELLKSGHADFVIVRFIDMCDKRGFTPEVIESLGYSSCYLESHDSGRFGNVRIEVYKKNILDKK